MTPDTAYDNADFIPGGGGYQARWQAAAQAFRAGWPSVRPGLAYGDNQRETLDLFLPDGAPKGLLVFVHGGYWLAFGPETFSHLAAGPLREGWAVAMPSYPLAPEVGIPEITRSIAAAVTHAAGLVAGPIHLTGHSAGGHLVARMACTDAPLPADVAARIARVVPISPVAELAPLTTTAMADALQLTEAVIAAESPARLKPRPEVAVQIWVGGQERPSFLWQARLLSEAWACPWTVDAGHHHFSVIEALADPDSALTRAVLA